MTDHPQYQGFIRAVCESPGDDSLRLILADWLDERGEGARAEFIRVQIELARTPEPPPAIWLDDPQFRVEPELRDDLSDDDTGMFVRPPRDYFLTGIASLEHLPLLLPVRQTGRLAGKLAVHFHDYEAWAIPVGDPSQIHPDKMACRFRLLPQHDGQNVSIYRTRDDTARKRLAELRRRERELLGEHGQEWSSCVAKPLGLERWGNSGITCGPRHRQSGTNWQWRRGFVESITLACEDFMRHAAALFAAQPITKVVLSDREPLKRTIHETDWFAWYDDGEYGHIYIIPESNVPTPLYAALPGNYLTGFGRKVFNSTKIAADALSDACVAHGREQAGLTPLQGVSA